MRAITNCIGEAVSFARFKYCFDMRSLIIEMPTTDGGPLWNRKVNLLNLSTRCITIIVCATASQEETGSCRSIGQLSALRGFLSSDGRLRCGQL